MPRELIPQNDPLIDELKRFGLINVTNFPVFKHIQQTTSTKATPLIPRIADLGKWSDTNGIYTLITSKGEIWIGGKVGELYSELIEKLCPEGYSAFVYILAGDFVPHTYWLGRSRDPYEDFDDTCPGDPPKHLYKEWLESKKNQADALKTFPMPDRRMLKA